MDEIEFVRVLTTAISKVTLPSPSTMHFWGGARYADPGLYESAADFFSDLATVYREEIADLAEAGARYVQLDEVPLAMLCDPTVREKVRAGGQDPDRLVDLYVEAINRAVEAIVRRGHLGVATLVRARQLYGSRRASSRAACQLIRLVNVII